eukprot:1261938-Prymnesium_polylepis.1
MSRIVSSIRASLRECSSVPLATANMSRKDVTAATRSIIEVASNRGPPVLTSDISHASPVPLIPAPLPLLVVPGQR